MVEFIAPDVEAEFGSNSSQKRELLVGVDGDDEDFKAEIANLGGDVERQVGRTTYLVHLPESELKAVGEMDNVVSIEFDEENVYIQEGNLDHDPASVM